MEYWASRCYEILRLEISNQLQVGCLDVMRAIALIYSISMVHSDSVWRLGHLAHREESGRVRDSPLSRTLPGDRCAT